MSQGPSCNVDLLFARYFILSLCMHLIIIVLHFSQIQLKIYKTYFSFNCLFAYHRNLITPACLHESQTQIKNFNIRVSEELFSHLCLQGEDIKIRLKTISRISQPPENCQSDTQTPCCSNVGVDVYLSRQYFL